MAWPTTKAGVTHLNDSTDNPNSARVDILQNVNNVNAIIDTFSSTNPNDGDMWRYNATSNIWEPTVFRPIEATIKFTGNIITGQYKAVYDVVRDTDNILTEVTDSGFVSGTNTYVTNGNVGFKLATGTYRLMSGELIYAKSTISGHSYRFRELSGVTYSTVFGGTDDTETSGNIGSLYKNFDQREFTVADSNNEYFFNAEFSGSGQWFTVDGSGNVATTYLGETHYRIQKIA